MNAHDAFLANIADNLHDDLPRLTFADYLEDTHEPRQPVRAAFIRTHIALTNAHAAAFGQTQTGPIEDYNRTAGVMMDLLADSGLAEHLGVPWLWDIEPACADWHRRFLQPSDPVVEFHRGFPSRLRCSGRAWVESGDKLSRILLPVIDPTGRKRSFVHPVRLHDRPTISVRYVPEKNSVEMTFDGDPKSWVYAVDEAEWLDDGPDQTERIARHMERCMAARWPNVSFVLGIDAWNTSGGSPLQDLRNMTAAVRHPNTRRPRRQSR